LWNIVLGTIANTGIRTWGKTQGTVLCLRGWWEEVQRTFVNILVRDMGCEGPSELPPLNSSERCMTCAWNFITAPERDAQLMK